MRSGSVHAIFAGRTTDSAGSSAMDGSRVAISHDHGAVLALVIIANPDSPNARNSDGGTTSASRRFSACREDAATDDARYRWLV